MDTPNTGFGADTPGTPTTTGGPGRVFFYAYQCLPKRSSSGAEMRLHSNLRAYLELGFDVEYVLFHSRAFEQPDCTAEFPGVRWSRVQVTPAARTFLNRLAYATAFPMRTAWPHHFFTWETVRRAVEQRKHQSPGAIHHFEYPTTANVIPWLPGLSAVYSCHDIEADLERARMSIAAEMGERSMLPWERRRVRFVSKAERLIAQRSRLVLCISARDAEYIRREWRCAHAHVLPMSVPSAPASLGPRCFAGGGVLRLLHLGSLAHLPSYRSLEFLFEKVFPRLDSDEIARIRLEVVGSIPEDPKVGRILDLGRKWPQVCFHGRVPDLEPFYRDCDLQVVGSTEATGLRTRIIESFALGLPVLSTFAAAEGIPGITSGEHISLAGDDADFAQVIRRLCRDPGPLQKLRSEARNLYDRQYSAEVTADRLSQLLRDYPHAGER